jgi:hypothetical protein
MLSPLRVFRQVDLDPSSEPAGGKLVGVLDEEVRPTGPVMLGGYDAQVDLDAIARGEAVATARIRSGGESKPVIMRQRPIEVATSKIGAIRFKSPMAQADIAT